MLNALDYEGLKASRAQQEAVVCARHFASARDWLLSIYPFVFARRVAPLAMLDAAPKGWRYAYAMPADCHRVLWVNACNGQPVERWSIAGSEIHTDARNASAAYTRRAYDVDEWTPEFTRLFEIQLAELISPAVTGGFDIQQALASLFRGALEECCRVGAIDELPRVEAASYRWNAYTEDVL